jgi:GT2 family glycosyltransferase
VELFDSVTHMRQRKTIAVGGWAATANLFVRGSVFEKVGLFAERLASGGDREWGERAGACGHPTQYAESPVVYHPARRSLGELIAKARRVHGGVFQLRQQELGVLRRIARVLQDFLPPIGWLRAIAGNHSLGSRVQRIRVGAVMLIFWYARAVEGVRLLLGGKPRR